ncbi:gamma-glutamylcyclotransferase [Roseomonas sp. OT10]|uniref:gamma-glutamylcyclotransferase n=1 Tax=Roseomonas cutis TaxID=2897332 RepID=UPI001E30D5F0|nr:gamma-glutamylcyclotransferase [Roseomonas sp. OT10]UFN47331.1 gamma-glutamylcyclotransferase [Roseomonas sp. OT10]
MTPDPIPPPAGATPAHPPPALDRLLDPDGSLYVFAYGSLIWRPGFIPDAVHPALLRGYHRSFCIRSTHYRGTPETPGLVLGLDRGGACRGAVLRVGGPRAAEVLAYLHEREMLGGVYHETRLRVRLLDDGREVQALAYVANRRAADYCGRADPAQTAATIARGQGAMGANRDYLLQTVARLRAMGVRDGRLEQLASLLPPPPAGMEG